MPSTTPRTVQRLRLHSLISGRLGVITAIAVIAHEVPEELADYVLLRNSDLTRRQALIAMTGVQLTAGIGAALTLLSAAAWKQVSGLALGIAAGTFLYIAFADLMPTVFLARASRSESRPRAILGLTGGTGARDSRDRLVAPRPIPRRPRALRPER